MKHKTVYRCQQCGSQASKWSGQCSACQHWNVLVEEQVQTNGRKNSRSLLAPQSNVTLLADVPLDRSIRLSTTIEELDRLLGGGLVMGAVILIGGSPGIGKSTLLLQALAALSQQHSTLYVSGEESLQQIALRAKRLNVPQQAIKLLAETNVDDIIAAAKKEQPQVMVIDSIQTLFSETLSSAPGSVGQVRESAATLVNFAKQHGIVIFLVGHVTKEGAIAGPKVLEHIVDTVLYFEGESSGRFRLLRAVKNRFGAVNELAIFAMSDSGLKEVSHPSAIFLSRYQQTAPGAVVMVTWEGSRPLLVEIQALVDESRLNNPRRVTVGLEANRLAMLLAILHRHGGVTTWDQDIFVNVVGGVKVLETAADLPLILTVLSSLRDRVLPRDLIVFGEIGLSGEIRPVQSGQERLKEAAKHGFKRAIVPQANVGKLALPGIEVVGVSHLQGALAAIE
ncbi:MAG: DNA repair protein RadA [Gammaproteobacteria bacterium]|nr:DNA repair protein RadA [Gammaproteobacteria bacterium]